MLDNNEQVTPATEAATVSPLMGIAGEPLKTFLCTDKIIEQNNLQPVTNPISFIKNIDPSPDGIFSEVIFGRTQDEKYLNHAYIDLKHRFFHPYVFEVLLKLHRNIASVCTGDKAWTIEGGKFVEVTDRDDKRYNEDNTGLDYVMDNLKKLKFEENDSIKHNDDVEFIKSLSKDEIFITKYIVIPRFYRDFSSNGRMMSVDPINKLYTSLISNCKSLDGSVIGYGAHKTLYAIQTTLVEIRKYGQNLIELKNGLLHKAILGKQTSYGIRGVISVPSLVGCDYPDDCQVDMTHTGIPLGLCIKGAKPFILKWLLDWSDRNLSSGSILVYKPSKDDPKVGVPEEVEIDADASQFDKRTIEKQMDRFINGFGKRNAPIKIKLKDGTETYMAFTGRGNTTDPNSPSAATISNRPLTWCDLMYMAAEDTLSDKHCYCTRYPAEDYFNICPTRVSVLSTIKTMPMMVNGVLYKHYPVIDPFADEATVSRSFIETIGVSNLQLLGFGGDYDGDTVSDRICFTQEANEEADEKIYSLTNYLNMNGSLIRRLGNESTLCMYNMTRRG